MKEDQSKKDLDALREMYHSDNQLGIDVNKLVMTDSERQKAIARREAADKRLKERGVTVILESNLPKVQ